MRINKQNLSLYLAIALPILLIAAIALAIYLPNRFAHPQYDFIYSQTQPGTVNYDYNGYTVVNGTVQIAPVPVYAPPMTPGYITTPVQKNTPPTNVKLFYYDVKQNSAHEISFANAQKYSLNANSISPDNYHVEYGASGGGVPFSASTDYSKVFLVGHSAHLLLQINAGNYYNSFYFLGWINK